jgi:uncharacterized SAM-binding protein YcdF (DUF218 family)
LEREYPPLSNSSASLNAQTHNETVTAGSENAASGMAGCILVLGGATSPKIPPQPTVQLSRTGNRVVYGAYLFRQGKAPIVICSGKATEAAAACSAAEDMAEVLEMLGVPKSAIITETQASNTYEHTTYVGPLLRQKGVNRVLLVTSAMHMPRSMLVFRKQCPDIDFIAAPTDFRITETSPVPWYRQTLALVPVPGNIVLFTAAMHEYFGIAYYKLRGWI